MDEFTKEELEEIEGLDLTEQEVTMDYQVWLIGYSQDKVTDFEFKVDNFDTGKEAKKCAQFFSDTENLKALQFNCPENVDNLEVVVEQVVFDENKEEIDTVNIYSQFVPIK